MKSVGTKHKNYEVLNLIGYGLSKFNIEFVKEFGFTSKISFYKYIVATKIAETIGTIKNRQDLFDPFFNNARKGWWQKGNTYEHRKKLIDSLFGNLNVVEYSQIVKLYLHSNFNLEFSSKTIASPIVKSKFKQLQVTGHEAEIFFLNNYNDVTIFKDGKIEDARLFGDGYDFQIEVHPVFYLAEIKGVRGGSGSIRLTSNEYLKAVEYKENYILTVISNLENIPKITIVSNPIAELNLIKQVVNSKQYNYHSEKIKW